MKARVPEQTTQPQPSTIGDIFERFPLLLMFYMLPEEYVRKIGYQNFPRSPYEFSQSPAWKKAYNNDLMVLLLSDAWAYMLWRHLGIKAPKESFTGYYPAWIVSQCPPLLEDAYLKMKGMRKSDLRRLPVTTVFTWPSLTDAETAVQLMAEGLRRFHKFDEMMEIVNGHLDFRDFENHRRNHLKIDFYRQYYHTRTEVGLALSWDKLKEDNNGDYIPGEPGTNRRSVESEAILNDFFSHLDESNEKIARMLYLGYTQEEIAQEMGFKTHSAITKRLKKIREAYIEYSK